MRAQASIRPSGQPHADPSTRFRATAKITSSELRSQALRPNCEPGIDGDTFERNVHRGYRGRIAGSSFAGSARRSICQPGQRATLPRKTGRTPGTFVLQGSEIVENGKIKAKWFVVPGSGTGELSGLRGEGGFEGEFGKGSDGTLDYWFE